MGQFINPTPMAAVTQTIRGVTGFVDSGTFTQTAVKTVNTTVTQTTLMNVTGAIGTKTIPANYLSVGSRLKIKITGIIGTHTVIPTVTFRVLFAATDLGNVALLPAAQIVNGYFELTADYTVATLGATGTMLGGFVWSYTVGGVSVVVSPNPATYTIDTTAASALDALITWSASHASNTITDRKSVV